MTPPMEPIIAACHTAGISGSAVIETRPPMAPLSAMERSIFFFRNVQRTTTVMTPVAAAMLGLTKMLEMAMESSIEPSASCEPPLKPNQPSHRIKTPSVASGKDEPRMVLIWPFGPYLPRLGPSARAPASAAQPPVACTSVDPAKSEKPYRASSQPPPHSHDAWIG